MNASTGLGELFAKNSAVSFVEVAAHIAQLDEGAPSVEEIVASFDQLVNPDISTAQQLMTHVFGHLGFQGNTTNYYDQANSYLHRVLETRRGIPISLSIVAIEIGARCGIEVEPIGMPAHLLLGHGKGDDRRWFDPMSGGAMLTLDGVQQLFASLLPDTPFDLRYIDPIGPVDVATRMLNNLRSIEFRRGDLRQLSKVVAAQIELPDVAPAARLEFAQLFASRGHFGAAIEQLEALMLVDPSRSADYTAAADRLRANFN